MFASHSTKTSSAGIATTRWRLPLTAVAFSQGDISTSFWSVACHTSGSVSNQPNWISPWIGNPQATSGWQTCFDWFAHCFQKYLHFGDFKNEPDFHFFSLKKKKLKISSSPRLTAFWGNKITESYKPLPFRGSRHFCSSNSLVLEPASLVHFTSLATGGPFLEDSAFALTKTDKAASWALWHWPPQFCIYLTILCIMQRVYKKKS